MQDEDTTKSRNNLIFSTVESMVSQYFIAMPDGTSVPDEEARTKVRKACIAFRKFFADHKLFKIEAFDESGRFVDREYRAKDLTEDGFRLLQRGAESWLDSKSAQKEPPDYSRLEKLLSEIKK